MNNFFLVRQTHFNWTINKTFLFLYIFSKVRPSSHPQMTPNKILNNFTIENIPIFAFIILCFRGKSCVRHFFGPKKAKNWYVLTSSKVLNIITYKELIKPHYNHP